ncbi:anti-sigma factor family protein [Allorhodopirellula solitaria]|uniref:Putative zinc-finger domain-containing protein n=1 Tax=Allorhodopirellula solitaria TaxID=2527987 RepID=A0A5C5Y1C6_9BACT|nr:zf-HC2 domain-containing protein [Allorhodopirellula solitaria]TWT67402.1 hypothetical protein CA85_22520 [Allorhodopirellula solitaria]
MNCQETRRHWDLYHDSEGDPELHLRLNEHLDQCASCRQWFGQQSRLESLIQQRLKSADGLATIPPDPDNGTTPVDWPAILSQVEAVPNKSSRAWLVLGSTVAALAASVLLLISLYLPNADGPGAILRDVPDLARLSAEVHGHVASGGLRPDFESDSDIAVDQYLVARVSFPVRCPPRKDSGFAVGGAGLCQFAGQPAAYVVGSVDDSPVSIFVLPRESLAVFPKQRKKLNQGHVSEQVEGGSRMVSSMIDQNVVVVVGEIEPKKLTRVLKSYGTYPHEA